jgi:hypothetical protein
LRPELRFRSAVFLFSLLLDFELPDLEDALADKPLRVFLAVSDCDVLLDFRLEVARRRLLEPVSAE